MCEQNLIHEFERVRAIGGAYVGAMVATDSRQRDAFLRAFGQECMYTFAMGEPIVFRNQAGQIIRTSPVTKVVRCDGDFLTKVWTKSGTYYCFLPNFSAKPFC